MIAHRRETIEMADRIIDLSQLQNKNKQTEDPQQEKKLEVIK